MKKFTKVVLWILGILLVLLIGVYFLNSYATNRIKTGIENQLKSAAVDYGKIEVNLLDRNTSVTNPVFLMGNIYVEAKDLRVKNLHYWDYIFDKKIIVGKVEIINPRVNISKKDTLDQNEDKEKKRFSEDILIKNIEIIGGDLRIQKNDSTPNKLYLSLKGLNLYEVTFNEKTLSGSLPFGYDRIDVEADSLFLDVNDLHQLTAKNASFIKGNVEVKDLHFIAKYDRAEFDRQLKIENDRFDVLIKEIAINDLSWRVINDSLALESPLISIKQLDAEIYRNKLISDDNSIKPLYSRMLREMKIKVKFDSVKVSNSKLQYEEKSSATRKPGMVYFNDMNVAVSNITNIGMDSPDFPETKVEASALLMNEAKLKVKIDFKINDSKDRFKVNGNLNGISADAMNAFLTPAMNVKVQGKIESVFFNFGGNDYDAQGDMKMEYSNFKVEILKKDGSEKNKVLSGIANIFVRNKAKDLEKKNQHVTATRDRTKSFWNFMWTFVKNGTIKTVI